MSQAQKDLNGRFVTPKSTMLCYNSYYINDRKFRCMQIITCKTKAIVGVKEPVRYSMMIEDKTVEIIIEFSDLGDSYQPSK